MSLVWIWLKTCFFLLAHFFFLLLLLFLTDNRLFRFGLTMWLFFDWPWQHVFQIWTDNVLSFIYLLIFQINKPPRCRKSALWTDNILDRCWILAYLASHPNYNTEQGSHHLGGCNSSLLLVGTCCWEFETGPIHIPTFQDKAVLKLRVSPAFASTYFCNHCNIRFENTSKYVDTLILFSKNLNQRSLTPTWPLTPCLLRSHVWLYPRIIVSKSHDNTSMYVDTVINLANYHIYIWHTTYIHTTYRMSDHIVSYWTQFRRDKKVTHSYTNRPDFGQNFDKVTSPPFFFIYCFLFFKFS